MARFVLHETSAGGTRELWGDHASFGAAVAAGRRRCRTTNARKVRIVDTAAGRPRTKASISCASGAVEHDLACAGAAAGTSC